MNILEQAERDLAITMENCTTGGATALTLSVGAVTYSVNGIMGDIGYTLDTEGNSVAGRSVVFAYRMSSLKNASGEMILPQQGWAASYTDIHSKSWSLFVSKVEPDRSLGICRLILCLGSAA